MSEPSELGALLFVCDRIPAKESYNLHYGGWGGLAVSLFFFGPLIALFPAGLLLAGYEKLRGPQDPAAMRILAITFISVMALVVDALIILYFRRGYAYAQNLGISAYEKGIVITGYSNEVCKRYDEIRDVYFGTRSQLFSGLVAVGKYVNRNMRTASTGLKQRLTFQFSDGTCVRIHMCFSYFPEEAIVRLLDVLMSKRPELFQKNQQAA